ncbi:MAG: alpha-amylase [Bacteroidetes bacterium]|nr:alpha-amylase [Bacteroidota bacterium]
MKMPKILLLLFGGIFLISCQKVSDHKTAGNPVEYDSLKWVENATIYEVNLRHYSPEGNIQGFIPHLDRLKNLGIDILWIMPIHPIGMKNRKAKGDLFVEDIADSTERMKYQGSPYSVQNYRAVNPDFGTVDDFKLLVKECHKRGMKIMLDWVANHTAWDHAWITEHPEWYTHKDGKITDPLNEKGESIGWTDVADLNYDEPGLRKAMTDDMMFWVKECDIDGFRCDVAFEVPADFWDAAVNEIRKTKNVFMLAEAEGHNMKLYDSTFQMYYAWNIHHQMNELAKGKITPEIFINEWKKTDSLFEGKAFPMNFITNHDENSWNGTEFERMGNAWRAMAVLSYALKGMPLIYTGQEIGLDRRLPFFEKDTIDWNVPVGDSYTGFYRDLNRLKAMHFLRVNAPIELLATGNILVINRGKATFMINCSENPESMNLNTDGRQILDSYGWSDDKKFSAWGYLVYANE